MLYVYRNLLRFIGDGDPGGLARVGVPKLRYSLQPISALLIQKRVKWTTNHCNRRRSGVCQPKASVCGRLPPERQT